MTKKYYAYTQARPNGQVFYVGKGHGRRAWKFKRVMNPHYASIIKKYGTESLIVQTYPAESELHAFEMEKEMIRQLREKGVRLANKTDGGEGASGRPVSDKVRAAFAAYRHVKRTPEICAKISAGLKGRIKSETERVNIGNALRGKKRPQHVIDALVAANKGKTQTPERKAITLQSLKIARVAASEWHGSDEGREWHSKHGHETWEEREWSECTCQQCGIKFMSPFPTRAKYCHQNCKAIALRVRRGAKINPNSPRRKPRVLSERQTPPHIAYQLVSTT